LFETAQLYQLQLSFTNFTTEQLSLRVGEVDDFVWLSDQLQLHKNKILVGIASYGLVMMLIIEVLFYILFLLKNKVLSINFIEK
jgi:hypothetical protein